MHNAHHIIDVPQINNVENHKSVLEQDKDMDHANQDVLMTDSVPVGKNAKQQEQDMEVVFD